MTLTPEHEVTISLASRYGRFRPGLSIWTSIDQQLDR